MKFPRTQLILAALAFVATLTGCSAFAPSTARAVPPALTAPMAGAAESVLDVATGFDTAQMYVLRPMAQVGPQELPTTAKPVRNLSTTAATVADALRLLAEASGLQLVFTGAQAITGPALTGVSGSLAEVLTTLTTAYGLQWHTAGTQLVVSQDAQYILKLPVLVPAESLTGTVETLKHLGARDVFLDLSDRTVVLRADGNSHAKIVDYLAYARANRSMIVYDVDVWQVTFSDDNSQGIDWSTLTWTYATGGLTALNSAAGAAAGFGLTYSKGKLDIKMLATWLKTQGTVKSISRPRIAIMAGSKGTFSVGEKTTYIAKVGSTATATATQTTVDTGVLETGLKLSIDGDVQDNTVLSAVRLDLSDLLSMEHYTAMGTEIALPKTATRQLETTIRARPGDTVLLGGITAGRDTATTRNSLLSASSGQQAARSELVIAIRPRIVKFTGRSVPSTTETPIATPVATPVAL